MAGRSTVDSAQLTLKNSARPGIHGVVTDSAVAEAPRLLDVLGFRPTMKPIRRFYGESCLGGQSPLITRVDAAPLRPSLCALRM